MRTVCLLVTLLVSCAMARAADLVVHEWGTFTSLQNEKGEAIGGINVDDEPVPAFVHSLPASFITNSPGPDEVNASIAVAVGAEVQESPQTRERIRDFARVRLRGPVRRHLADGGPLDLAPVHLHRPGVHGRSRKPHRCARTPRSSPSTLCHWPTFGSPDLTTTDLPRSRQIRSHHWRNR